MTVPQFPQPTLTTGRLTLRPLQESDATVVAGLAGDERIARMTLRIPHPYSVDQAVDFIRKTAEEWSGDAAAVFAAVEHTTGRLVGTVGLVLEFAHRRAELGYWVAVEFWGRGFATEMARGVLSFAFERLPVDRVHAHAFGSNVASCRVLEKAGMVREGVLRRHVLKNDHGQDRWEDAVMYGVLREEMRAS
ncbi:MAG: GNAT family N-acetyltransferase [Phycisphaerales bacterium]|nr:GNAT family N-acetyltransferase [Phycisphaerales bacterium]